MQPDEIRDRLPERGAVRYEELLDGRDDDLRTRQAIEQLVLEGEVKRFPVGEHIMLRRIDEDASS